MAGFHGPGLASAGAHRENSVWAGGVGDGREVDGELDWASFQSKRGLDEQRFMGVFFSGVGNIPKCEEKTCREVLFSGHKLYLPKEGT